MGTRLYFQFGEDCRAFSETLKPITYKGEQYMDYDQGLLGIALGFPPYAVNFFAETQRHHPHLWKTIPKANINYYGIVFVCHRDDVEKCLDWYKKMYKIPHRLKGKLRNGVREFIHH